MLMNPWIVLESFDYKLEAIAETSSLVEAPLSMGLFDYVWEWNVRQSRLKSWQKFYHMFERVWAVGDVPIKRWILHKFVPLQIRKEILNIRKFCLFLFEVRADWESIRQGGVFMREPSEAYDSARSGPHFWKGVTSRFQFTPVSPSQVFYCDLTRWLHYWPPKLVATADDLLC